ncbi:MAG: hypothetical protein FJX56_11330 [Alphaproteobacteria bacterium]|nr:hypothetical protein [Alphaproteobacteria bacterium]
MTAWEIIDHTLRASGWPDAATLTAKRWHDCQPDFATAHFLTGFPTADRKFHFRADWDREGPDFAGLPRLPDHCPITEEVNETYPLRLVTAPARNYLNSSFNETPGSQAREGRPRAKIHPATAAKLAIGDGALVRLGSRRGETLLWAEHFAGLKPDVVVVESIHPNRAFPTGIGINALTGADPAPPNGGAAYHDTAIWARPA